MLKRLKNIEDKTDNQLKIIEGQKNQSSIKSIGYSIKNKLPKEAIKAFDDLVKKDKTIDYKKLSKDLGGNEYDFTMFFSVVELFKQSYHGNILVPGAEREQDEFYYKLENLKKYDPTTEKNISKKESFVNNIQNFYDGREMVIKAFKNKIIPLVDGSYFQYHEEVDTDWIEKPEEFNNLKKYSHQGLMLILTKRVVSQKILVYLK